MKLELLSFRISKDSFEPYLIAEIKLTFNDYKELPISIKGDFDLYNSNQSEYSKKLSFLIDNDFAYGYNLSLLIQNKYFESHETSLKSSIKFPLNNEIIDYMEYMRLNQPQKSLKIRINGSVKYMEFKSGTSHLHYKDITFSEFKEITASDWINNYSELLNIGKFLVLEYKQLPNETIPKNLIKIYNKMFKYLKEMEVRIKEGDWILVMKTSRNFIEVLYEKENNNKNHVFKPAFKKILVENGHSESSIKHFHQFILHLFQFISQFDHEKDLDGKLKEMPIVTKEDAYLIYSLSFGILHFFIGKFKISSSY